MTVRIRTTIQPDREIEVSEGEARDLAKLGLLDEDDQPKQGSAPKPRPVVDNPQA
jgi:hypothetical protein